MYGEIKLGKIFLSTVYFKHGSEILNIYFYIVYIITWDNKLVHILKFHIFCTPLLVYHFLYSYEAEVLQNLIRTKTLQNLKHLISL